MTALNYLQKLINNRSAFVPAGMAQSIAKAGAALGYRVCGGLYDPESHTQVLYIAL